MKKLFSNTYNLLILVNFCALISIITFYIAKHDYVQDAIVYSENNNVDYKVYLKENDFFDEPYLGKNQVYISSLINNITIDFRYNMDFNKMVNGSYDYYIKGIISATKENNESSNYWQKEYLLSDKKEVTYSDTERLFFNKSIVIDYQKYNDLLLEFKKMYNLSLDANLKIMLYVDNHVKGNKTNKEFTKSSVSELTIPLTKATVEVPIGISEIKKTGVMKSKKIPRHPTMTYTFKTTGYVSATLGFVIIILIVIKLVKEEKLVTVYHKKLRKILKTYDYIIVNVVKLPNLEQLSIIEVSSFEELLDAHSEVRQPINFKEDKLGSTFILINDKTVWKYFLAK